MAHKTFISYKYSEAQNLRDRIIKALGDDASYYKGETSDSPDLTDTSTENIKKNLKDMMYDTSVTIVVISPHIKESKWIDWEVEYCLKNIKRKNRTSHTNGVVGVIMKVMGAMTGLNTPQLTQMDVRLLITMIQRFMTLLTIIDIIRIPRYMLVINVNV